MTDFGLVSIVMPSYNCEKYIEASIKSVLSQTYTNWELLIVDDCSQDNTLKIIESFADKRIQLFVNEHNSGAAISRNIALAKAKGKWIAFLDADDIWLTTKLEEQLTFMVNKEYHFSFTDYRVSIDGSIDKYIRTGPNVVNYKKIKKYCYFFTSTVVYDSESVGLIQIKDLKKNNDYAMWIEALKKVSAYRYPKFLSIYNKHKNSISSEHIFKLVKWHYILFRNQCEYSRIHSALLTTRNLWYGFWKKVVYKKKA